jgi:hypothetical protein
VADEWVSYATLGVIIVGLMIVPRLLEEGVIRGFQNYGGWPGVSVAAGQVCAKDPNYGGCPGHLATYGLDAPDSSNPVVAVLQQFFRAGQTYPFSPNPYSTPDYLYAASGWTL